MDKAGTYLKNLRQEKGFTVEEVSKKTKMSPSVVKSIEEGRTQKIDPVYLKGFLKLYCRFLEVDWENFRKEHAIFASAKEMRRPAMQAKEDKKQESSLKQFFLKNKSNLLIILYTIAIVFSLILLVKGCVLFVKKVQGINFKKPVKTTPFEKAKGKAVPISKASHGTSSVAPVTPTHKEAKSVKLVIRAKEKSFIKVKVDGKPSYQGDLLKGKSETYTAKEKIELTVGNAAGIELEVDGRIISSLGKRNQAIKNMIIDSNGLKIP